MLLVGCLELLDEAGEEFCALGFAGRGVVIHQITAAAAEDFTNGSRREVTRLRRNVIGAQQIENFLGITEYTAVEWIDEERQVVGKAANDEVARKAHRFEFESEALRHQQVHDAQRKRNSGAALEHLVEEAVARIGVVFDVAVETPFVKQHAIEDAAFLAAIEGSTMSSRQRVAILSSCARQQSPASSRGETVRARSRRPLELVIVRADEAAKFGDRIGKFQLVEKPGGVTGSTRFEPRATVWRKGAEAGRVD